MNIPYKKTYLSLHLLAVLLGVLFVGAYQAHAQSPTLDLVVDPPVVVNGQSVELSWYIDGSISSCSINNGVGAIDVSTLPATGSMTVIPPNDSSIDYVLSCDGGSATVNVATEPIVNVNFSFDDNSSGPFITEATTGLGGEVEDLYVHWSAEYATRCGYNAQYTFWYETESAPGVPIYQNSPNSSVYDQVVGNTSLDLTETATFYVRCENTNTGTESTGSATFTVLEPAPPGDLTINIWTDNPIISADPSTGSAIADVGYQATNAASCGNHTAYYENGTQYSPNPFGWPWSGGSVNNTTADYDYIIIAETTRFEITCSRPAITIGGITYPATSTTESITVQVIDGATSTRASLPPVTIALTVDPNPATTSAGTGVARVDYELDVRNAEYCLLSAFDEAGDEYTVNQWTHNRPDLSYGAVRNNEHPDENNDPSIIFVSDIISLATTTRLTVDCRREADYQSGDPLLIENGTETLELWVTVNPATEPIAAANVEVYANAVRYHGRDLYDASYNISGFQRNSSQDRLYGYDANNTLTFNFDQPHSTSTENYDVYLDICDTVTIDVIYRLYDAGGSLLGSYATNDPFYNATNCFFDSTYGRHVAQLAADIPLSDGQELRFECENFGSGDDCLMFGMYFGVPGSVELSRNSNGFGTTSLMWMSDRYVDRCNDPHYAYPTDGIAYPWANNSWPLDSRFVENPILVATTTDFRVECENRIGVVDVGSVTVALPTDAGLVVSALVSSGECIDPGTLATIDAPDGYWANPTTGLCEPAVDLAADNPTVNIAGATENNIDGTYSDLDVRLFISNYGPGELLAGSNISYRANITPNPYFSLPVFSSTAGSYPGTIVAPPDISSPTQSSVLTRDFDDVPFGTHDVCAIVNLDSGGALEFPEHNPDTTNNTACGTVSLPVPPPPMELTADREVIRSGQTVDLTWLVNVTYRLDCSLQGAGGLNVGSFNTLSFGNPYSDTFTTGPLTSTSEFTFSCTEPLTNTTFTERLTVEVVPDFEEI